MRLQDNEGSCGTTNKTDNQSDKTHYMSTSNIGLVQTESSTQILSSAHSDYIHHVSFDIYGRRMATCSGDCFVRIWNLHHNIPKNPSNPSTSASDGGSQQEWIISSQFQAHRGPATHVCWSHAEFGTLVATCGIDGEVKIWEETTTLTASSGGSGTANSSSPVTSQQAGQAGHSSVGNSGNSHGLLWITRANLTEARKPVTCVAFAPRHVGLQLATASADGTCRIYEAVDLQNLSQWPLQGSFTAFSGGISSCLSWSTGRFEPPTLVVGGSTHLAIWRYSTSTRQWAPLPIQFPKLAGPVLDVAWAPNVGRRFHWIASTEQGGPLRVYQLDRISSSPDDCNLVLKSTQALPSQDAWKCQWNVTGTVLAASGDAGVVQLWKSNPQGEWKCVSQIHTCEQLDITSRIED
jgi:nucleoporin SEH1